MNYIAIPFLTAFGMGLILRGVTQSLYTPGKIYGTLVGVLVLLF